MDLANAARACMQLRSQASMADRATVTTVAFNEPGQSVLQLAMKPLRVSAANHIVAHVDRVPSGLRSCTHEALHKSMLHLGPASAVGPCLHQGPASAAEILMLAQHPAQRKLICRACAEPVQCLCAGPAARQLRHHSQHRLHGSGLHFHCQLRPLHHDIRGESCTKNLLLSRVFL